MSSTAVNIIIELQFERSPTVQSLKDACYGRCANPAVMIAKIWRGRQQASILRRMDVNIVNHPIEAGWPRAGGVLLLLKC